MNEFHRALESPQSRPAIEGSIDSGPILTAAARPTGSTCCHVRALGRLDCLHCGVELSPFWPSHASPAEEIETANTNWEAS